MIFLVFAWGCGSTPTTGDANGPEAAKQTITIAERPQKVKDEIGKLWEK